MKKPPIYLYIVVVALLCLTPCMYGQTPTWEWAKSIAGNKPDDARDVQVDINGNIYVTGLFSSDSITFGATTLVNAGRADMFIAKYDADGNVLWAKSAGGHLDDLSMKIAIDNSGNMYVTGIFSGSINFGTTTLNTSGNGDTDIFIVKYSSNGDVVWAKSASGKSGDFVSDISIDKNGDVYLTGTFMGTSVTFGTITLDNPLGNHGTMFVVRYDTDGNVVWAQSHNANQNNFINGISIASENENIVVSGYYSSAASFGTDTLKSAGSIDIFIVKYDLAGNVLWAKSAGGLNTDVGRDIAISSDGSIYITGYYDFTSITFDTITIMTYNHSGYDMFIAKYDANGNVVWATSAGGFKNDIGTSIATDKAGNIVVTGSFSTPTITFGDFTLVNTSNYPSDYSDSFVVKYDKDGNVLWVESIGGFNDEISSTITTDNSDNRYITGSFNSYTANFKDVRVENSNPGVSDIFIAKLSEGSTSIIEDTKENLITIFPNPTKSTFHISNFEPGNWNITIYTLEGQSIYQSAITDKKPIIDLSGKAKGTYIYQLQKEGEVFKTGKLILE